MVAAFWNLALPSLVVLSSVSITILASLKEHQFALNVFKLITFGLMIGTALLGVEALYDKRGLLILAGLTASLVADLLLPKHVNLALLALSAAALSYMVAFTTGVSAAGTSFVLLPLFIFSVLSFVIVRNRLSEHGAVMFIYILALIAMTHQAAERYLLIVNLGTFLALGGALLLYLSNLGFAFGWTRPTRGVLALLHKLSFYIAQWCLALSLHVRFT